MASIAVNEARQVGATVNYVAPTDEPLYNYYFVPPPPGRSQSNEVGEPHEIIVHDLRDVDCRLDVQGFELMPFRPTIGDIYDEAERRLYFYPAVAELVKSRTGASDVRVFDPFLRGPEAARRNPGAITAPAGMVHVDYTHDSGPRWFDRILGEEADRLRGRRFAIINVWCPITGPLQDHPLAMCDVRTIDADDYRPSYTCGRRDESGLATPDGDVYETETYALRHNPAHRWYYAPDMMPDEALLLKNYESQGDGVARFTPHTAFRDRTAPSGHLPRASIEVRALTIW
jgi:hypothetical protein